MRYHDGGDDGDEGVAVGQQPVGGLGPAVSASVGRTSAVQGGGGGRVHPCVFLLHLLLDVVFYDVAVVVSLHGGGATGPQVTQRGPWTLTADTRDTRDTVDSRNQLMEEAEAGSKFKGSLIYCLQRSAKYEESHSEVKTGYRVVVSGFNVSPEMFATSLHGRLCRTEAYGCHTNIFLNQGKY